MLLVWLKCLFCLSSFWLVCSLCLVYSSCFFFSKVCVWLVVLVRVMVVWVVR